MTSVVVVGAQWGDEGKGKLVDYLTSNADWVVRFQGGNNAGHTLVVDGVTTKLNLVPSGILRPLTTCAIGAGVVIDAQVFEEEVGRLTEAGVSVTPKRLIVDRDAHLVLPYHRVLDKASEESLGSNKIGTTGRGIGPAYVDRAARRGIRIAELASLDDLRSRVEIKILETNSYLEHVLKSVHRVNFDEVWTEIERAKNVLYPFIGNVSLKLDAALTAGKKVVFEGAQGTLLDQVHGTFPFVTSSNTISGAATTGSGVGPHRLQYVLGVAKAYSTRVGAGPFPTELDDSVGNTIREKGREFGTVTGRPRRCGWFDAMAVRRAVRLNGFDSIALTKLDVLSGFDKLKICRGYRLDGKELDDLPALAVEMDRVEPIWIELSGWTENLEKITDWKDLPESTRLYTETISEIIGCPVSILSVGAQRRSTLFSENGEFLSSFCS